MRGDWEERGQAAQFNLLPAQRHAAGLTDSVYRAYKPKALTWRHTRFIGFKYALKGARRDAAIQARTKL